MKYLKQIYIVVLALLASLSFSSCDTDLDAAPSDQVDDGKVFVSFDAAETALVGTYKSFGRGYYNHYFLAHAFILADIMGDDVYVASSGNYGRFVDHYQLGYISSTTEVADSWGNAYRMIENANMIINGLGELPDGDRKNKLLGESRALRAYAYHYLVRMHAKPYSADPNSPGVILRTISSIDPMGRSSVQDAYSLIVGDLEFAANHLAESSDKGFIGQKAAQGLLARVYLDMGSAYADKAVEYATKASANVTLLGTDKYATEEFSKINSETLWAYTLTSSDPMGYLAVPSFYYFAEGGKYNDKGQLEYIKMLDGYSSLRVSKTFIDIFDDADVRKKNFPLIEGTTERLTYLGGALTAKHRHIGMTLSIGSPNLVRASEMYLIVAEVEADRNAFAKARIALNTLRKARGLADYAGADNTLVDEIQKERRRELYGEGFRFFDLKRRQLPLTRTGVEGQWAFEDLPASSPKFQVPLPQKEMDANKGLSKADQNPGY